MCPLRANQSLLIVCETCHNEEVLVWGRWNMAIFMREHRCRPPGEPENAVWSQPYIDGLKGA